MALLKETHSQYYDDSQSFVVGSKRITGGSYTLTFDPIPAKKGDIRVFRLNGSTNLTSELSPSAYDYENGVITTKFTLFRSNDVLTVKRYSSNLGGYQFIPFNEVVGNFMVGYVGNGKIIDRVNKTDVVFHGQRALQEFSYDIFRTEKAMEFKLNSSTLSMPIPHDYVNYVSVNYIDESGVKRPIQKTRLTDNASFLPIQDEDSNFLFDSNGEAFETDESVAEERFKKATTAEVIIDNNINFGSDRDYEGRMLFGQRYGKEPEITKVNGFYTINERTNTFNFSSDLGDKIIHLEYVSDGLGTTDEMKVHKFAEEAVYKQIAYAILSNKPGVPEYIVQRFKKERYAAMRNAKIRLSNLKTTEIAQVMRGKSKQIKR